MTPQPPSREAQALIDAWPADDWVSEDELGAALAAAGHRVFTGRDGALRFRGRRLRSLLGEARRRSWLLRDQRVEPVLYKRPVPGYQGRHLTDGGAR